MKNRNLAIETEERENRMVRKDFLFVVILNTILLGLMFGLFFYNRATGQLDQWFSQIIKF